MVEHSRSRSDMGIGFAVLFGLLAVVGGLAMYVNPGSDLSGWGFAAAMVAGVLLVSALHLYGY